MEYLAEGRAVNLEDIEDVDLAQMRKPLEELTYPEIGEAVEDAFGKGSVGLGAGAPKRRADVARATFVRASLLLVVRSRLESMGDLGEERKSEYFRLCREVRGELAGLLGIDENEVFRLHHRAAGLRAKDPEYREKARMIERELAERHGMVV